MQSVMFVNQRSFLSCPKYSFLDKCKWWIVKKLGGSNPNETVTITTIPIDEVDFMSKLYAQKRDLFRFFNLEATTLLIGAEDYQEMMNSPNINQMFSFRANFYENRREVYGLTVKVIPWMRGCVVMPKE